MNRCVLFFALALFGLSIACESHGAIIHESAMLGPIGQTSEALAVIWRQYLGSRFRVNSVAEVEFVGGHLGGNEIGEDSIFAAIVSLSSPTALPSGSPFDMTTVATTVFDPPCPSEDILVPLTATLEPGDYALIFGANQFGASRMGGLMPYNNSDIPGSASYFKFFIGPGAPPEGAWLNDPFIRSLRFVVTGRVIPEPSRVALFWLGSPGACGFYRRLRDIANH